MEGVKAKVKVLFGPQGCGIFIPIFAPGGNEGRGRAANKPEECGGREKGRRPSS